MPMIRISPAAEATLGGILDALADVSALRWSMTACWAMGADETYDVKAIEDAVDASDTGLEMTVAELRDFDAHLLQLIDGVLAGFAGEPPSSTSKDLRDEAEIVIEVFDSTYWTVYANDPTQIEAVRRAFPRAQTVDPEVPMPAQHDV